MTLPTPDELRETLATMLAGAAGGNAAHWRKVIGPVTKRSLMESIQTNWTVEPGGSDVEREAVARAVEIARDAYPYVG
jgi:hypothetical protein